MEYIAGDSGKQVVFTSTTLAHRPGLDRNAEWVMEKPIRLPVMHLMPSVL